MVKGQNIRKLENGCDVTVCLEEKRKQTKIKLLQLTDIQFIDSLQRRTPDRLRKDEIIAWMPDKFDVLCGNQIRSLVTQTEPDLIFITGDIVYGSFDDNGTMLIRFCKFMDSLQIPWAPVFGNHDNESAKGVRWQCEQFAESEYCLFERGTVSGNGNYTVGISVGDELVRVLHLADSNGCSASDDPDVIRQAGLYADQLEQICEKTRGIWQKCGRQIPAFLGFHIPTQEFSDAEQYCGYKNETRELYTIGVDVPARNGDFGFKLERYGNLIRTETDFMNFLKECRIEAVFTGHYHQISTVITYEGVKWVYGLKTGQYDYHVPGQLGGTLVELDGAAFCVRHVPSLVSFAPFPGGAKIFQDFFVQKS